MQQKLAMVAIVVDDYDKAIAFYTERMNFQLVEDTSNDRHQKMGCCSAKRNRWLPAVVGQGRLMKNNKAVLETKPDGRVFLFLHTDDLDRDYALYRSNGLKPVREPADESLWKGGGF